MKLLTEITGGTPIGGDSGGLQGIGPLGQFVQNSGGGPAFVEFTNVFSTAIGVLTVSAGIWFIIQILAGSFQWLTSGGDKDGVQKAQKRLTNAIMGLFVVIFSYALITIVGTIFGINILSPIAALLGYGSGNIPAGIFTPAQ